MIRRATATGLLSALLGACAPQSNESLVFTIEQALATSPAGADFSSVIPGDWDRLCVFRPRTSYARVDSVLGTAWAGVRSTGIEAADSTTLLAFVRGNDVVAHVMYPVAKGDFGTPGPEQWYCRPREAAVFQLRQPIDGAIPWIGPRGP